MTEEQSQRYARHLLLPDFGEVAQQRLFDAKVLLIGAGGLGSPCALYLAAAGIGQLTIIDNDEVELSNLQRQILHTEHTVGTPKGESAQKTLNALNSGIDIRIIKERFSIENAESLVAAHDIIVDGSDNFETRFLANDACHFGQKPLVYGSIYQFEGQLTVFDTKENSPCYRCLVPQPPAEGSVLNCLEAGVIGTLPGIIGSLQAMEVIKCLTKVGKVPLGKMLYYKALQTEFKELSLVKDPKCPLCSPNPTIIKLSSEKESSCSLTEAVKSISVAEFLSQKEQEHFLIDVREPKEFAKMRMPGSQLIPLGQIRDHLEMIPRDRPLYIHCHSGGRSAKAAQLLMKEGFDPVLNIEGGVLAYQKLLKD